MIKFEVLNNKTKKVNIDDLNIANFERKINSRHLNEIKRAMLSGDLKDNIITIIAINNQLHVIDGQHRLIAAKALHDEKPSFEYCLALRILEGDALNTYLNINKGKPLTANDYTKAIDCGYGNIIPFFRELKDYCTHYGSTNKLKYSSVIASYAYAIRDGFNRTIHKESFESVIMGISKHNLIKLQTFLYDCSTILGKDVKGWQYKSMIISNLMKLYFEYFNEITSFQRILKKVNKDAWLKHNSTIYNTEAFIETYEYLKRNYIY